MIEFSEESWKSHEEFMQRTYGIGTDILYASGIEERTRLTAERLEEQGLDVEDLLMDDGFVRDLYHDYDVQATQSERWDAAEKLGYDL